MKAFLKHLLLFGPLFTLNLQADPLIEESIPVIDMELYDNPLKKAAFIEQFTDALHKVGFCAIVNTKVNIDALESGYQASRQFFKSSKEKKLEIFDPKLNGQRGLSLSEIAQGKKEFDYKEFFHVGRDKNLWPRWMDLRSPMENLIHHLDEYSEKLQVALSVFMEQPENYLKKMTENGECILRSLYYPKNPSPGQYWAAAHTDIDLFTILPMSTEEGLEVLHEGKWIRVKVPKDAFIINCGDMLENLSNGYFKSSVHRVVSQPDKERFSIVYFVHPKYGDRLDPLASCIRLTGGVQRFPDAAGLDMLAHRLVEIGLASEELKTFDAQSGYMEKIEDLVARGVASPAVEKTHSVWQKIKSK